MLGKGLKLHEASRVATDRLAGLGVCHGAAQSSRADPHFLGHPLLSGEGSRSVVTFRNFSAAKPSPMLPRVRERGQAATGRAGGRRRVKGGRDWDWELEEQLHFISNSL